MTAWSFSAVAFADAPLMRAVVAAAVERRGDFSEVDFSSLLWSVSPLFNGLTTEGEAGERDELVALLRSLVSAPIVSSGVWRGHSLCLIANALFPLKGFIDRFTWDEIELRWERELRSVAGALRVEEFPVRCPEQYIRQVMSTGCFHAGPHFTRHLLGLLDIREAPEAFSADARDILTAARRARGIDLGILCVMQFSITSDGGAIEHQNLFISDSRGCSGAEDALLVHVPLMHDRSGHAEFLATGWLLRSLSEGGVDLSDKDSRQALTGFICIHVTHHPCLSCIAAFAQLRSAMPGVQLKVSYDWKLGVRGR